MNKYKLLNKVVNNIKNVSFDEFIIIIEMFDFILDRVNGSHHIFKKIGIQELINIQNVNGMAKPYQIKQFFAIIEKYNIKLEKDT
jgi:hypothetical protein